MNLKFYIVHTPLDFEVGFGLYLKPFEFSLMLGPFAIGIYAPKGQED